MGRQKKQLVMKEPVRLREQVLKNGNRSLYLDNKFHSVQNMDMRLFFPQELNSYLKQIGFNIIHKFGNFTEREFEDNSEKQIYILELEE